MASADEETRNEDLEALGRHVADIAHELRNVVHSISSLAEVLQARLEDDETSASIVRRMLDNAALGRAVLENILGVASNGNELPASRDPGALLRSAVDMLPPPPGGIERRLVLADDLPETPLRQGRMTQLVHNLVRNAERAMSDAEREGAITIEASADAEELVITVADEGPGVPSDISSTLFAPFTTRATGGTGLGLALCRTIAREHGGDICLATSGPDGSRFEVRLPLTPTAPPDLAAAGLRILAIDDDDSTLESYRMILELDGHTVVCARTGGEGLVRLESESFDVILVDVKLPDVDGPSLYRSVEADHPKMAEAVVFATGDLMNESTREFLNSTGNPYLIKPFDIDSLRAALAVAVNR